MTTDPIVTHADLGDLLDLRSHCADFDSDEAERKVEMLDRLIAAAEADAPPLPEGWVLVPYPDGSHGVWWYPGHGDRLTRYDDGGGGTIDMASVDIRHEVTPLRPTITEGGFLDGLAAWQAATGQSGGALALRAAFAAAGVVIEP